MIMVYKMTIFKLKSPNNQFNLTPQTRAFFAKNAKKPPVLETP